VVVLQKEEGGQLMTDNTVKLEVTRDYEGLHVYVGQYGVVSMDNDQARQLCKLLIGQGFGPPALTAEDEAKLIELVGSMEVYPVMGSASPRLHYEDYVWRDKVGAPWVCAHAVQSYAPWVTHEDIIQLLAYCSPLTDGVELVMNSSRRCYDLTLDLQMDGIPTDSHDALQDWLREDHVPKPAYVVAHIVERAKA
jgi:hypothetical protein